jgi:hypothetical protein
VCAGAYTEQVVVPAGKNNLTLRSKTPLAAVIKAPAVMVGDPQQTAIVEVAGRTTPRFASSPSPGRLP